MAATNAAGETRLTQNFRIGYNLETAYVGGVHYAWSTPSPPGGVKALTEVAAGYPLTDAQARAVIKAGLDAEYNAGGIYAGITTDTTDLLNVALPYTDGTNYVLEVLGSDSDQVYFQDVLVSHPSGATNVRWRLNYMTSSVGGTPKSSILSGSMTENGDGTLQRLL